MAFHLSQFFWFLLFFGGIAATGCLLWKKRYKTAGAIAIVFCVMLFAMPVRIAAPDGGADLERSVRRFDSIPDRITVEKPDFDELREEQLTELKERSQELENNVQN